MNLYKEYKKTVMDAVKAVFPDADAAKVVVSAPKEFAHGDLTTNAAMVLAKDLRQPPPAIAEKIAAQLRKNPDFTQVQTAGGYVNIRLADAVWDRLLTAAINDENYGASDIGRNVKVNVEYISANPTGPVHIGHVRIAMTGDALAGVLQKAGFAVTRESYTNDKGMQVTKLAKSLYLRYEELITGSPADIPDGYYPGEYMIDAAQKLRDKDGDKWLGKFDETYFKDFAVDAMMDMIRADIALMGINMDLYSSEQKLYDDGKVEKALKFMEENGLSYRGTLPPPKSGKTAAEDYEPAEQLLFRATQFGDDCDRTLIKSDGAETYFLSDIAYHYDKLMRGFTVMYDVWGADHAGYVPRLTAAVKAITRGKAQIKILLCQIVRITKGGQPFKLSKRAGNIITVADLLEQVTKDELRFYMLTRRNDAQMAFDIDKVKEQSKDNLVFYVQYAHARACSVLRKNSGAKVNTALLADPHERALLQQVSLLPVVIEEAAAFAEPHRVTGYLNDLATRFHSLWTAGNRDPGLRFSTDDAQITGARIALVKATQTALAGALRTLGVTPVQRMESSAEV
ncbi:MAG: arginine--tRNA ligase [Alphaproteobacteria bacterium]|nr:arginine--tRNA ligase [Alphaproteobacteria bacterium]